MFEACLGTIVRCKEDVSPAIRNSTLAGLLAPQVPASALFLVCYEGVRMLLQSARTANLALPRGVPLPEGILVPKGLAPLVVQRPGGQEARKGARRTTGATTEGDSEWAESVQSQVQEVAETQAPISASQGQAAVTQDLSTAPQGKGQVAASQGQRPKAPSQGGVFQGVSDSRQLLCLASLAGTITFHS